MDDALIKRVLPHSLEAEQSVIGSMLMDREAIITASEIVTADDFYQHQYGVMYESMVELFNEGKPVDLVTLQNRLKAEQNSSRPGICPPEPRIVSGNSGIFRPHAVFYLQLRPSSDH